MSAFKPSLIGTAAVIGALLAAGPRLHGQKQSGDDDGFRFRSGVELVNVTATVTDSRGRFVPGLRQEDFVIYEDTELQQVTHFSNERVPVSLGVVLDTSGSMAGDKMVSAQAAVDRFLTDLLDPADELFLFRFDSIPDMVEEWTTDRRRLSRAINRLRVGGGTAMYDAVAEAVPYAETGQNRKKAVLLISDGNDTDSSTDLRDLKALIRETEVLVYAIGIDGQGEPTFGRPTPRTPLPIPFPFPIPIPGRRGPLGIPLPPGGGAGGVSVRTGDRVNIGALRDITDDSGGRTETVRSARDLDPATASIADELSRQYYLGYPSTGKKDGRWHTIRVEVKDRSLRVRARRGYIATP
jgi:VWFA-related protein